LRDFSRIARTGASSGAKALRRVVFPLLSYSGSVPALRKLLTRCCVYDFSKGAKKRCPPGPLLDYTVLTLCYEATAMSAALQLPAERLQDEELLVIRESARLMGKSLEPGLVTAHQVEYLR
jgi:hypothetical protein